MQFEPFHRGTIEPFVPCRSSDRLSATPAPDTPSTAGVLTDVRPVVNVMYHYVRAAGAATGSVPLTPEAFEQQLDLLSETFGPRQFRLTFDDGTRDHYDIVFPILRARGLTALFGVLSGPGTGEAMPNVHLIHHLLATGSPDEVLARLVQRFGEDRLGRSEDAARTYPRDTSVRARMKYALNFGLSHDDARAFLLDQVAESGRNIRRLTRDAYISAEQIQEMAEAGMQFAVHGHLHRPVVLRSPEGGGRASIVEAASAFYAAEIEPCERWLADLLGIRPTEYIVPFGAAGTDTTSRAVLAEVLRERGYVCGYLTRAAHTAEDPFWHGRVDCADLPMSAAAVIAMA